ncbi:MAG TPA: hypothetical protein VMA98_05430 [Candidatus Acidoferrales bacterium]|nr:hypothetical protein [Candidatus Acidoferrales bacterium]
MRRWLCAMQIGVLVAVLWPAVASASPSFAPPPLDLSAQLFARCFGEAVASSASFAQTDETNSPLRGLAFRVDREIASYDVQPQTTQLPAPTLDLADSSFAPPPPPALKTPSLDAISAQLHVPAVEYYESALPLPTDAPATHRFGLANLQLSDARLDAPSLPDTTTSTSVNLPLQVGRVRFSPHAEAGTLASSTNNFTSGALGAGATLNLRAGKRNLGVDLSSGLEHLTLTAPQFSANGASAPSLSADNLPVFVPAYADVSAHTISTGVTVPVTRSLTANVQYDTQHLLGAYGVPGISNLDANNTIYGAQLTFRLPNTSSAISLSTHQYRFQDNLMPSNALTTFNTNLNFTIKF